MMSSMKQIEDPSAVDGPVVSEGGRSPSTLSTGQAPTRRPWLRRRRPSLPAESRPLGTRPALERRAQARGRPAPAAGRERRAALPRARPTDLQARAMAAEGGGRPRRRAQGARRRHRRAPNSPPPCSASASSAWRSSCCAPHRASRPFGPAGGRGDGRGDLPRQRPPLRHRRVCRPGACRAPASTPPPPAAGATSPSARRRAAGRNPSSRRGAARRHPAPTWSARPGPARATARSGRGCACATASGSPASGSCA